MFIVFEGIDGSGKTTISNKVSAKLRATGLGVTHVREGGSFTSSAAQAIRELGRDARNLMLTPLAELMLYVARDGQSLEEMILPALGSADVVIADRFLYSAQLLATAGRGLPADVVASIVAPFAARVTPDLNILVDAPPDVARGRRKVSKLHAPDHKPSSRKGLAGGGLQVRLRQAHRELAEAHPDRWLIVENSDTNLDSLVDAITTTIELAVRHGVAIGLAEGRRRLAPPAPPAPSRPLETVADARAALLDWIDRRAPSEPDLAAYVLSGCRGEDIDVRRRALASRAPVVLAHGLAGLDDAASWSLRDLLHHQAPDGVARSLAGLATPQAYAWRRALLEQAPAAVAVSLGGLDDAEAWALREALQAVVPEAVTASIGGLVSPQADAARRRWLAANSEAGPPTYLAAKAAAKLVTGQGDDLAWRIRKLAFEHAPVDAIVSLKGDTSPRAWRWREKFAERAPRPVAESLTGMTQPAAWAMRRALAGTCREIFQSMVGLDGEDAWELREVHADTWPSTVCKSLGLLADTPRGIALVARLLAGHQGISLLRNAAKLWEYEAGLRLTTCDDAHGVRRRAATGA